MTTDLFTQPMTPVQTTRLFHLITAKYSPETAKNHAEWLSYHIMSEGRAAEKISELEAKEDWTSQPAVADFEHGAFYMVDGVVYRVKLGSRGFFYAEELEGNNFNYAPGAIRRIRVSDRMTLEQAKEYGIRTHTCGCCGRTLTNPDSIEMGIGPICASKHF